MWGKMQGTGRGGTEIMSMAGGPMTGTGPHQAGEITTAMSMEGGRGRMATGMETQAEAAGISKVLIGTIINMAMQKADDTTAMDTMHPTGALDLACHVSACRLLPSS
jgi:hypothetical protein